MSEAADKSTGKSTDELIEYRVTFGSQYLGAHTHATPHPRWTPAHRDGWLTVLAPDETTARLVTNEVLAGAWSTIYSPAAYLAEEWSLHFPLGELGRMHAGRVADGSTTWTWPKQDASMPGPKPIVWVFCDAIVPPTGDQYWMAVADDGRVIAVHVSSSEYYGPIDVGPQRKSGNYHDALGTTDVDLRVLPVGDEPPPEVIERARQVQRAEASESADRLVEHLKVTAGSAVVVDGNADSTVTELLGAGWTWAHGTEEASTQLVEGKRIRQLVPPATSEEAQG